MKIKVLGSAAAECIPAIWCECDICKQARERGGKEIRRRTSYLIDNDTLVDFGPDIFSKSLHFNFNFLEIKRILFTHSHGDHLSPIELLWRKPGFSIVSKPLKIMGGKNVFTTEINQMSTEGIWDLKQLKISPILYEHGKTIVDGDLKVTPLNACHDPNSTPFVLLIERDGKKLFICNDTGFLPDESWQFLKNAQIDFVFIDSNCGFAHPDAAIGHMGVNTVVKTRDKLLQIGALKEKAPAYMIHFSHNGKCLHTELEKFASAHGLHVAYDGLTAEI